MLGFSWTVCGQGAYYRLTRQFYERAKFSFHPGNWVANQLSQIRSLRQFYEKAKFSFHPGNWVANIDSFSKIGDYCFLIKKKWICHRVMLLFQQVYMCISRYFLYFWVESDSHTYPSGLFLSLLVRFIIGAPLPD